MKYLSFLLFLILGLTSCSYACTNNYKRQAYNSVSLLEFSFVINDTEKKEEHTR